VSAAPVSVSSLWLLDIGNTRGKYLRVEQGRISARGHFEAGELPETLRPAVAGEPILVASVEARDSQAVFQARLEDLGFGVWYARPCAELDGLRNSYEDPARMGVDRWLGMLAARTQCAGRLCVVDAGSALTIDLIAASGSHEGGYIIPGVRLMERALLADTHRVRFSESVSPSLSAGRSTAEAVVHGLALAQTGAVRMALEEAGREGDLPQLVISGGDAQVLLGHLGAPAVYLGDLVFQGLLRQAELEGVVSVAQPVEGWQ
jgi:type III pantothenate kinase